MIFIEHAKTPKSTLKTNPLVTTIDIIEGTITLVSVQFPPGVNALAHCKILWGLYQLFPSNEQGDFATGGETVTWDENIEINAAPFQLTMMTWNEDDTYDHTITARIVMQPSKQTQTVQNVLAALVPSQFQSQQG